MYMDPVFVLYRDECLAKVARLKAEVEDERHPVIHLGGGTYATTALVRSGGGDGGGGWEVRKSSIDMGVPNQTAYLTILREVDALRKVRGHPNVVRLLRVDVTEKPPRNEDDDDARAEETGDVLRLRREVTLALEYLPVKLTSYLRRCKERRGCGLTGPALFKAARDVLSAVECCHAHGVLHRDIKTANLMVSGDGTLKLIDFGLAKPVGGEVGRREHHSRDVVTLGYRPPEFFAAARHAYGRDVDVWSAGIVIAELATGDRLFDASSGDCVLVQELETFAPGGAMPEGALPGECPTTCQIYGTAPDASHIRSVYGIDERELPRSLPIDERVGRLPFAGERDRARFVSMVREAAALSPGDRPPAAVLLRKYYDVPSRYL